MKSEHAIAQQEQRNSGHVEILGVGVKGNPNPQPKQFQSEMTMLSEIIMQPQPKVSEPKLQYKETKKHNKQQFA